MPRRGNPFQSLVRTLHEEAAENSRVRECLELRDRRTGQLREVDIVLALEIHGYPILVAVECTATSRPADVTWVDQMIEKHADLPTNKLVLVSASGFSGAAVTKATAKNVETLHVEELGETAWPRIIGKKERVFLQSLRASVGIAITTGADESWPGQLLSFEDVLVRDDVTVPVPRLIDAVLAKLELLEVALTVSTSAEGRGCTIEFRPAPGIRALRADGSSNVVSVFHAVLLPTFARYPIELQAGLLGSAAVAFGGARDEQGRELDVAVVEWPNGVVRASWTERVRGEKASSGSLTDPLSSLEPATDDDIRALLGRVKQTEQPVT